MAQMQFSAIYGSFRNKMVRYNCCTKLTCFIAGKVPASMASTPLDQTGQNTLHCVYLALGSNLGNRQQHLADALEHLQAKLCIERVSSIYETAPVGYLDQPPFFNLVCQGTASLSPLELLRFVKDTEIQLGRQPTFRNGPRVIDIDLLLYDHLILHTEQLTIPHPRMAERAFVLVPLVEIAPDATEPATKKTAQALLAAIPRQGVRKVATCQRII
jgi:2-amino-4-hydroxy-6-hydroxymethyldihydropteridine diphosphokinase